MIIAIAGADGSGKDTVGSIITTELIQLKLKKYFDVVKFSEAPSDMFEELTGLNFILLGRKQKEFLRPKFVDFCEGIKKVLGNKVFALSLLSKYKEGCNWIITDLRFQAEYEMLKKYDAEFLFIKRDKGERPPFEGMTIIDNTSDLDALHQNVKRYIETIKVSKLK